MAPTLTQPHSLARFTCVTVLVLSLLYCYLVNTYITLRLLLAAGPIHAHTCACLLATPAAHNKHHPSSSTHYHPVTASTPPCEAVASASAAAMASGRPTAGVTVACEATVGAAASD